MKTNQTIGNFLRPLKQIEKKGHLFQDRYKSKAIETNSYFLTVLRYINQNPTKALIIKGIKQYPWSSYQENTTKLQVCDIVFALKIFSEDYQKALELFSEEPLIHS